MPSDTPYRAGMAAMAPAANTHSTYCGFQILLTAIQAMTIIAWMAVNKIWNPQYVLWVFAAGAIAAMPARYGVSLGILSAYDYWFEFVLRLPDQPNSYSWVGFG